MNPKTRGSRDRRGAALALVAVFMLVLLAVSALSVDMAMGFASHAEAQRAADASALAGASAFMDQEKALAEPEARNRAYEYGLKQTIRGEAVDSSEVTIQVITDSMKVRVWVHRQGLSTWFARILGVDEIDVSAKAAAQAVQAGAARCLKPFAIPDIWDEPPVVGDDVDNDNVWDPNEQWVWGDDPGEAAALERYERYEQTPESGSATGYGGTARVDRVRDQGRQIPLKLTDPTSSFSLQPGLFFPFRIASSPDQGSCDKGPSPKEDQIPGAAVYRTNICECNMTEVQIGDSVDVQPGNMIGPTDQGIEELISEDRDAYWVDDPSGGGSVKGSSMGNNWMASPRVVKIALVDPTTILKGGMQKIVFNNFALFFLENAPQGGQEKIDVLGRFIKFASGSGQGPTQGSLVMYLRLVE